MKKEQTFQNSELWELRQNTCAQLKSMLQNEDLFQSLKFSFDTADHELPAVDILTIFGAFDELVTKRKRLMPIQVTTISSVRAPSSTGSCRPSRPTWTPRSWKIATISGSSGGRSRLCWKLSSVELRVRTDSGLNVQLLSTFCLTQIQLLSKFTWFSSDFRHLATFSG